MTSLRLMLVAFVLLLPSGRLSAHGGRTDAQGGHYNQKTGSYHYHGSPNAYRSTARTANNSTVRVTTPTTPRTTYRSGSTDHIDSSRSTNKEETTSWTRPIRQDPETKNVPQPKPQTIGVRPSLPKVDPKQLFQQAEELFAAGERAEALILYRKVVSELPNSPESQIAAARIQAVQSDLEANEWLVLARNYHRAGRDGLAIEYCLKILEVYPESAAAQAATDLHKGIVASR